jgi:hypothetical protein
MLPIPTLMKRLSVLAMVLLAASTLVWAEARVEMGTYVEGTVTGFAPNTGGTLTLGDTLQFKTENGAVTVPFESIVKADLSGVRTHADSVPLYKVWAFHKRFTAKTKTQLLTLRFTDEENAERTMTIELPQEAASTAMDTIEAKAGKLHADGKAAKAEGPSKKDAAPSKATGDWWGDKYWKTNRNAATWGKPAGSIAPQN